MSYGVLMKWDETKSTAKWHDKAAKQLQKLNHDCNNTAGLEAVLTLAVGARVMLRRNIAVKSGLVNGAIGTVRSISPNIVSVKFDHLSDPCDIERVKGKFIVLKKVLCVSHSIPTHFGLCCDYSQMSGIVDLSERVFADGMAYVALSRVRSLAGLHLIAFDSKSIRVNVKCLKEINRLRELYRKDLPLYDIPVPSLSNKRKLTGTSKGEPALKKKRTASVNVRGTSFPTKSTNKSETGMRQQNRVWPF